ncbi:MAG: hypothetical protein M3N25_01210 [Actinomycetota bacterium]|nr:hypothetical protein [Actinomycetota bacterium]
MSEMPKLRMLAVAAAVLVGACGGGGDDEASPTTTAAAADGTPTTAPRDVEGASITLESPGAVPRQVLRFQVQEGDTSEATMTMAMSTTVEADGQALPGSAIPPVQITIRSEVVDVADDSDTITTRFSYADANVVDDGTVDPQAAEAMREGLSVLHELSGTATINSRGEPVSSEFDVPDDLDPTSRQMLEQVSHQVETLTVPLPEEEVGVGAIWRADTSSSLGGIDTVLRLTYELKELEATRYVLAVSYEQTAPLQEADFEGAPDDAVATVQDYRVTGGGELVGDLTEILPASSTMAAGGDVVMHVEDDRESIELRQRLDFDIRLESSSAGTPTS